MRKASGIIALIAGIISFFAAIITLVTGGVGNIFLEDHQTMIVDLLGIGFGVFFIDFGWVGIFLSFAVIVLGAVQIGTKSSAASILMVLFSLGGVIVGGNFVAVCLALSLMGGILGLFEKESSVLYNDVEKKRLVKRIAASTRFEIVIVAFAALILPIIIILLLTRDSSMFLD